MAQQTRKRDRPLNGIQTAQDGVKSATESAAKGSVKAAEQVSHFQYAPTFIALAPVILSMTFGSHSEHWTDLMLLGLVAIYLHHCVSVPWDYYRISRKRYRTTDREGMTENQIEKQKQLRNAELQAFFGLVLGPLLGASLLHYTRGIMARPANGLITNFNVSVFVLAAELRPVRIAYTYLNNRSDRLQQELVDVPPSHYENLLERCTTLEREVKRLKASNSEYSPQESTFKYSNLNKGDSEIVQIKTALRRLERHEAQMKQHYDEQLTSMEHKLADLMNAPHRVNSDSSISTVAGSIALLPFKAAWSLVTIPARLIGFTHDVMQRKRIL